MNTYQAILIHPDISGGRLAGDLQIDSSGFHFKSKEANYSIPFHNLSISAGGAGNRFVFFKDKEQEEISIYTANQAVLKNDFIAKLPHLTNDLKQSKKVLNKLWTGSLIALGVIILFFGGLYLAKDKMVHALADQMPIEWEQKIGDKLFTAFSLQYHFIKNDSLKKEFLKVATPLFKQAEKQGYTIELYFVKDPTINAFALPGGKVIVQTGLIENAKSWEEVMGVLGHELAHVTNRHHLRGIINNLGIFAILSATLGDFSALAGTITSMGGDLASLSNSRSFEMEADETGWNYLVSAKINPQGLISFFETLKEETKPLDELSKEIDLSFLSTHPDTQDRIDTLKKKETKLHQKFKPLANNFEAFKKAILKLKTP